MTPETATACPRAEGGFDALTKVTFYDDRFGRKNPGSIAILFASVIGPVFFGLVPKVSL
jgi:hypothetical protein